MKNTRPIYFKLNINIQVSRLRKVITVMMIIAPVAFLMIILAKTDKTT